MSSILYGSLTISSSEIVILLKTLFVLALAFVSNLLTAKTTCDKNNLFNSIMLDLGLAFKINGFMLFSNTILMLFINVLLELFILNSSNKTFHSKLRFSLLVNFSRKFEKLFIYT